MRTRFAPSPTGPLHLGHAYSALLAHDLARANGGSFILRIEDLDQSRARPEWERLIYDDLAWLGITWDGPVLRQSDRADIYADALRGPLGDHIFACHCNRRDVMAAAAAPQDGEPAFGPDGIIYPGTCAGLAPVDLSDIPTQNMRLRLDRLDPKLRLLFHETCYQGTATHEFSVDEFRRTIGSVVLWRQHYAAYHLASVIDDHAQGITHVIRGSDLFESTQIHVLLQHLLGYDTPNYCHHRLITDEAGKRLAKRHDAKSIQVYRDQGATPADIRRMVGLPQISP